MSRNTSTGRSKAWIAFVVVNALITFFGASYVWFPGPDVVKAGYVTEGLVHVPAAVWGTYVMLSALTMLAVTLRGLRPNLRWARTAALYQFLFLALVVVLEPDPVVPPIFAAILAVALWRLHRAASRSHAAAGGSATVQSGAAPHLTERTDVA